MARSDKRRNAAKERQWRGTISRWRRSGLTIAEFCRQAGVSEWSFHQWKRRLGEGDRARGEVPASRPRRPNQRRRAESASLSPFVPVQVMAPTPQNNGGGVLEVVLRSGHVLRVAGPCDPAALAALAGALAEE